MEELAFKKCEVLPITEIAAVQSRRQVSICIIAETTELHAGALAAEASIYHINNLSI